MKSKIIIPRNNSITIKNFVNGKFYVAVNDKNGWLGSIFTYSDYNLTSFKIPVNTLVAISDMRSPLQASMYAPSAIPDEQEKFKLFKGTIDFHISNTFTGSGRLSIPSWNFVVNFRLWI